MHDLMIAKVRQDERNRLDEGYVSQLKEIKQEAARLTRAGLLDPTATAYRAASAVCEEAMKHRGAASSASHQMSQNWHAVRLVMDAKADTFEELADQARRTRHTQAMCAPGIQRSAATQPTLQPPVSGAASEEGTPLHSTDALELESASWDETVARANQLKAEADQAHATAVAKLQRAQAILTYAAQASRFGDSQHRLAQAWVGATSVQSAAQQGDITQMRRDAVLTILGFGQDADADSATSLEGSSVSVISRTYSTHSSWLLDGYDLVAEAASFAEAP